MAEPRDSDSEVPERTREHLRRRDRKRETRMIVDNAGVKRVLPAIARRASPHPKQEPRG